MGNSTGVFTSERSLLKKSGKVLLDDFVVSCTGMTEEAKFLSVKDKIESLKKSFRLPPIRFINYTVFAALGELPRCPEHISETCELPDIKRDESLLIFISHCWMRGSPEAEGWDGKPHPDNAAGDKYRLCVDGIGWIMKHLAPRMKECYIWLDFGCINQDGNPAGELEQLDKIVECCDAIFTPIVDLDGEWTLPFTNDFLKDYKAKLWNEGPHAYLNRGWCRVEMLYAANIPVMENTSSEGVNRHTLFEAGLAHHCSMNRRPHLLFGHNEVKRNTGPLILPPFQNSYFEEYHPLKGHLSVPSDRHQIELLVADLQPYMEANKVIVGYEGERNEAGQRHGHGVERFHNGDVYSGQWRCDVMEGVGSMHFVIGDVYGGDWVGNNREGEGTFRFANGSVYRGEWKCDLMHGVGDLTYANGNEYTGQWVGNVREGRGVMKYACGDVYEGEWQRGVREGRGELRCAGSGGERCVGEFRNDVFMGESVEVADQPESAHVVETRQAERIT